MNIKRCLFLGLLLHCSVLFAQKNRNLQVRALNTIVDYMDEASRINQLVYFDLLNFSQAYFINQKKKSPNYWHSQISATSRLKSGGFSEFPELKLDKEGFITDYDASFLPLLRTKKIMEKQLLNAAIPDKQVFANLRSFSGLLDSMVFHFKTLVGYIHQKKFNQDPNLQLAEAIINQLTPLFHQYKLAADNLYTSIQQYYTHFLPPLKTQASIQQAQQELLQTVRLLEKWEAELYTGNNANRKENDRQLHDLYETGKQKDSFYLRKTYGYNFLSNGAFPHARYQMFYSNMPSTIFWFNNDTIQHHQQLTKAADHYNAFVNRYNWTIHYYNQFIENADGMAIAKTQEYSIKMAADVGIDTAQNVLLKKPRIGYQFALQNTPVIPHVKPVENPVSIDTGSLTPAEKRLQQVTQNHTVYLLDISNSMLEQNRLDSLKKAILYLVSLQRPEDRISVIAFADKAQTVLRFEPCNHLPLIAASINQLKTKGATNAVEAINSGYQLIDSIGVYAGVTKLMIITDGVFDIDKQTKKLLEAKQKQGIILSILLLTKYQESATVSYFNNLIKKGKGRVYTLEKSNLRDVLIEEAGTERQ